MLSATYSPDDNKLRLYSDVRLGADTYARVKAAGFRWAPKQELFVAPAWTPEREDLLLELCGSIDDEDTSLVERAQERAERFEGHSARRAKDAERAHAAVERIADGIPLGQPILVGHHSEKRARKDAEKIESGMRRAVKMWETSQYWLARAEGALRHAKYKERPGVRARRIKTIEADKRKHERSKADLEYCLRFWRGEMKHKDGTPFTVTHENALAFCNVMDQGGLVLADGSHEWSAWSALNANRATVEYVQEQRLTMLPQRVAHHERWIAHCENRLAYERAMLDEAGGTAADRTKPEKGGACKCWASPGHGRGWSYIKKVNKVSVTVEDNWGNGGQNFTRTIPLDKLSALMSKADVDAARSQGAPHFVESSYKNGFFLAVDATREPKPAPQPAAETPFDAMKETLEAGIQVVSAPRLFPTPPQLADLVAWLAEIQNGMHVLEPSAGTGSLLKAVRALQPDCLIIAIEINPSLAEACRPLADGVTCGDFLTWNEQASRTFDRIVMNPPFAGGSDIKHVEHALTFLRPGGRLVAVVANGPRQRDKLMPLAASWHDLPEDAFKEQGTSVRAAVLVIER